MPTMPKIRVIDEAFFSEDAPVLFQALRDQFAGRAHWWHPYVQTRTRPGPAADRVGAIVDVEVRRPGRPRFAARTVEVVPDRLLRGEYVEGDFRGQATWTLEPLESGTRLRLDWDVRPQRTLFRLLAPLVGRGHSRVMRAGFEGLRRYLQQNRQHQT